MTQQQALDILKLGHNVYLTGPAGSGKTYLLNQYIAYLHAHKIPVGVTASTGIAATHMNGTTIHSWVGMGIRDDMTSQEIGELFKRNYLRNRFLHTKVLIIDEISMLHNYRLELVDKICQAFRRNGQAFGGMQIVMCGDFFQLPPVERNTKNEIRNSEPEEQEMMKFGDEKTSKKSNTNFVYTSHLWQTMGLKICYLEEQFRQDDRAFLRVLNDIRNSEVTEMTMEHLSERINKDVSGYVKPTRLYTHNIDVDAINLKHLGLLSGEEHEYIMSWRGSLGLTESLRKSCLAPEKLVLKKGAQVMFVKNNYEAGYVNGTLGEVIGFDADDHPLVRTFDGSEISVSQASWDVREEDIEKAAISQLPLRLAWAITIHKSQGMTLDAAEIDLSRSFLPGMGYVALSRVRNLSGLKLMGMNQMAFQVNADVAEIDREFIQTSHEAVADLQKMTPEKKQQLQEEFLKYVMTK